MDDIQDGAESFVEVQEGINFSYSADGGAFIVAFD